jgi:hypothetical protein
MNNLQLIANFRNQARSSLIVPNRVILCASKYRKEPGGVLEGWSVGLLEYWSIGFSHMSRHSRKAKPDHSITPFFRLLRLLAANPQSAIGNPQSAIMDSARRDARDPQSAIRNPQSPRRLAIYE